MAQFSTASSHSESVTPGNFVPGVAHASSAQGGTNGGNSTNDSLPILHHGIGNSGVTSSSVGASDTTDIDWEVRLGRRHDSAHEKGKDRRPLGAAPGLGTADLASGELAWSTEISLRCQGSMCTAVGLTHVEPSVGKYVPWTIRLAELAQRATNRSTLLISPWLPEAVVPAGKSNAVDEDGLVTLRDMPFCHRSFQLTNSDRVTGVISTSLRKFPAWKKQYGVILIDLGKMDQAVALALASWCDASYLLLDGAHPVAPRKLSTAVKGWASARLEISGSLMWNPEEV